jgi:hypothetical protein
MYFVSRIFSRSQNSASHRRRHCRGPQQDDHDLLGRRKPLAQVPVAPEAALSTGWSHCTLLEYILNDAFSLQTKF